MHSDGTEHPQKTKAEVRSASRSAPTGERSSPPLWTPLASVGLQFPRNGPTGRRKFRRSMVHLERAKILLQWPSPKLLSRLGNAERQLRPRSPLLFASCHRINGTCHNDRVAPSQDRIDSAVAPRASPESGASSVVSQLSSELRTSLSVSGCSGDAVGRKEHRLREGVGNRN